MATTLLQQKGMQLPCSELLKSDVILLGSSTQMRQQNYRHSQVPPNLVHPSHLHLRPCALVATSMLSVTVDAWFHLVCVSSFSVTMRN